MAAPPPQRNDLFSGSLRAAKRTRRATPEPPSAGLAEVADGGSPSDARGWRRRSADHSRLGSCAATPADVKRMGRPPGPAHPWRSSTGRSPPRMAERLLRPYPVPAVDGVKWLASQGPGYAAFLPRRFAISNRRDQLVEAQVGRSASPRPRRGQRHYAALRAGRRRLLCPRRPTGADPGEASERVEIALSFQDLPHRPSE